MLRACTRERCHVASRCFKTPRAFISFAKPCAVVVVIDGCVWPINLPDSAGRNTLCPRHGQHASVASKMAELGSQCPCSPCKSTSDIWRNMPEVLRVVLSQLRIPLLAPDRHLKSQDKRLTYGLLELHSKCAVHQKSKNHFSTPTLG